MRLYSPVDLAGNVNMIEKLVLGGTGTGDLPIRAVVGGRASNGPGHAGPGRAGPTLSLFTTGRAEHQNGPRRAGIFRPVTVFY